MQKAKLKEVLPQILILVPAWRVMVLLNSLIAEREQNKALVLYSTAEDPLAEFESRIIAYIFTDPGMLWINLFGLLLWSLIATAALFFIISILHLDSVELPVTPQLIWQKIGAIIIAIIGATFFRGFPITLWHRLLDHPMPNGTWRFALLFGFLAVGSIIILLGNYLSGFLYHKFSSQRAS